MSDSRRGFGLEIGFIGHFQARLLTTFNYSAIANLTLQITRAYRLVFSVCTESTSRFMVTASNSGDSSASALTPLPASHRLTI
jgi:hypothetical protein